MGARSVFSSPLDSPRISVSLDGSWNLAFDPDNRGVDAGWPAAGLPQRHAISIPVPSIWNLVRPGYEGVAFYQRAFTADPAWRGRSVRLRFDAVNYAARVWLNGRLVGSHEGGYTPFWFSVADRLRYDQPNLLVVRVVDPPESGSIDGLTLSETACSKETWYYRYGGIWGGVVLEIGSPLWIENIFIIGGPDQAEVSLTIHNESGGPCSAALEVTVVDSGGSDVASVTPPLEIPGLTYEFKCVLPVASPSQWSPERPVLYHCCVRLQRESLLEDACEATFGFRQIGFDRGRLILNGAPIQIRGILYQPSYPATLVYPPDPDLPERELRLIKNAGFNLIRFHLRPPPPGYLALADRLGLMVYEETPLAWIAEGSALMERCRHEVHATLRRDRNHPSVVMWGIFNENQRAAQLVGQELLRVAHELDPSRPIIDNSGGAGAIDPGGAWSEETHIFAPGRAEPDELTDLHCYVRAPMPDVAEAWLAGETSEWHVDPVRTIDGHHGLLVSGLGRPDVLNRIARHLDRSDAVFISEFGYGGLPDFDRVLAHFRAWPSDLVDRREQDAYFADLGEGLVSRGLASGPDDLSRVIDAAQHIQAEGDRRQIEAIRRNPRVAGYVLTQFQDASWEMGAGLVDMWRDPKAAYYEMAAANAQSQLSLRPFPRVTRLSGTISVDVMLLGEPLPGASHLQMEAELPSGEVRRPAAPVMFEDRRQWQRASEFVLDEVGVCRVRAALGGAQNRSLLSEAAVWVLPPVNLERPVPFLTLVGSPVGAPAWCAHLPRGLQHGSIALVPDPDNLERPAFDQVLSWVRNGGRAIFFEMGQPAADALSTGLQRQVSVHQSLGFFVGCFHYVRSETLQRDLPIGPLVGEPFGDLLPLTSLNEVGDVFAGAFTSEPNAAGSRPGWAWWADIQRVALGAGHLLLCQYRLRTRLDHDPLAQILFRNLLEALST